MSKSEGKFQLKKKTLLADVLSGKETDLPESDLCFQDNEAIYQFSFEKPDEETYKEEIKPGIFSLAEVAGRITLKKTELRSRHLLTSVVNAKRIVDEADIFFKRLHVYEQLGEPKARKILIHSEPGMGKTSVITHYCQHAISEDAGTVVLIWPTSEIESHDVSKFLSKNSKYTKKCTRLILVMEDIGGGEREGSGSTRAVDSAMLDLLDGLQVTFKLPTFIIATTNYPQNLLSALADRPGRFDLIMALKPPSLEEKCSLASFIAKRELTEDEKKAFGKPGAETFSVAHIKEVIIRSMLHDRSISDVVTELVEHKKLFTKGFEEKEDMGFGGFRR